MCTPPIPSWKYSFITQPTRFDLHGGPGYRGQPCCYFPVGDRRARDPSADGEAPDPVLPRQTAVVKAAGIPQEEVR